MAVGWIIVLGTLAVLAVFGKCAELYYTFHVHRTPSSPEEPTNLLAYNNMYENL